MNWLDKLADLRSKADAAVRESGGVAEGDFDWDALNEEETARSFELMTKATEHGRFDPVGLLTDEEQTELLSFLYRVGVPSIVAWADEVFEAEEKEDVDWGPGAS